ncbi:MAG: FMN-binding protein [Bacillota bacterium]|nr:FMN-binding protein [Bacillota bacterium]
MKKKTATILAVLSVVVVVGYFVATGMIKNIESNLAQLADLPVLNVDLSKIKDGTYAGNYMVFPVSAEVEVTVENHKITGIEIIKHTHGQGATAEIIPAKVVENQTLEVDTVSGATYSSKVILKAIENALLSASE